MKKLYEASKKQILSKLEYIKKILAAIADITKSFAAIIASLVAGITAGITGYYEIKKIYKKEITTKKHTSSSEATGAGPENTLMETTGATSVSAEQPRGYYLDMNSGAFITSILVLGFFMISKLRKKSDDKNK